MNQAHYLRVARALTLAALVPGCTTSSTPDPAPVAPQVSTPNDAAIAVADANVPAADAARTDAGYPFSSGPIVPPELPASFA
jgi:hypothetical protein